MKPEGKQEGLSEWLGPRDATPAGELEFFSPVRHKDQGAPAAVEQNSCSMHIYNNNNKKTDLCSS